MIEDYKKLLPFLKKSSVINSLLNVLNAGFDDINVQLQEAFNMLDINKCRGEWLDNLGQLIGVYRPTFDRTVDFLKSEDMISSIDTGLYYIDKADTVVIDSNKPEFAGDDEYRMFIKSQIIRNNLRTYSVNDLESIAKLLFFKESFSKFYIEVNDYNSWKITVHIDESFSHTSIAFLRGYHMDRHGRKKFYFPYPPLVTSVNVNNKS